MNGVDRVKAICKERKIPISKLERDLGYANGYIGQLRKGVFPSDRLMEIANYLSVSHTYILTGEETHLFGADQCIHWHILNPFRVSRWEFCVLCR